MTVAYGTKSPRPRRLIAEGAGIKHAVYRRVVRVNSGVLGVKMENSVPELVNSGDRIDSLPKQMARVKVSADCRAYGLADFQHGFRIVNTKSGMRLKCDLINAMLERKGNK